MKTLKVMAIVGLALSLLTWIVIATMDAETASGWGALLMFYLIAFSITVLSISGRKK